MITVQQLISSIRCPQSRANKWIEPLNKAMEKYEINTSLRIAHFLAQVGHESGRLIYVREIASGKAYDNRTDLGNTKPEAISIANQNRTTPGQFYKGHGLIQITGFNNHSLCGKALEIDLINQPYLLEQPDYAALSAAWFWSTHNLNSLADQDLFVKITKVINGGTNGLTDRQTILGYAKEALGI
jgi:putative chitinase